MKLILASSSPRRRQLLESLDLAFATIAPDVDELRLPGEEPWDYVERIARLKAVAVIDPEALVIAADTTVVSEGRVMGKPVHPDEARQMLIRLSGASHEVLTGVAVRRDEQVVTAVESTIVRFLDLTEEEISDYVQSGEPMDKAGAYALGGLGAVFIDRVEGSPSNVIGLPLHTTARLCRALGVELLSFRPA
ncbi:nucleoside triphosphate pyrophosphatase [soil metagenome]